MKNRAFLYVILAGVLWGMSGIFVKNLSPFGYTSFQMTLLRGTVTLAVLLGYAVIFFRKAFCVSLGELLLFALTGLALFGTGSCYFLSMQTIGISGAVVLMYTAPVYVTVWSVIFFSEKMSVLKLCAVSFMLLGCVFVSGIVGTAVYNGFGLLMGILSGVCYGAYNILTKISMRRGSSAFSATIYSTLFMCLIALLLVNPAEIVEITAKSPIKTLPWIIGIGIVTFVVPYLFYTLALRDLSAGTASSLSIIEPMSATVFGIMLYGEKLSLPLAVGVILIIISVILLGKEEKNEKDV